MKENSFNRNSRLIFSLALLSLLIISLVAYLNLNKLIQKNREVIASKSLLLRIENVHSYLKDAETAQRVYSLTGNDEFIQNYTSYKDSLKLNLSSLYLYSESNILHSVPIDSLEYFIGRRIDLIDRQLQNMRTGRGYEVDLSYQGRSIMQQVQKYINKLRSEEERLLQSKINANNATAQFTSIFVIVFSLAAITMAIVAFFKIDKNYKGLKAAEGNLKAQKEYLISYQKALQGILNISTNGVMLFDAERDKEGEIYDFNLLIINPAAKVMLQFDDSIVGSNIKKIFPPIEENGLFAKYKNVVENDEQLEIEHFSTLYNKWFYITAAKLEDGIAITFTDINERKQSEQALLESKLKFESIFNQTVQFMALVDSEGRYIDVNQTILNFTGVSRNEFINKDFGFAPVWSLPGEVEKIKAAIKQAAQGENVNVQVKVINDGKNIKYLDIFIKPFVFKKGGLPFLMVEGRDITAIIKANEEIKGKNRLLDGILNSFPIILLKIDKQGKVAQMSGSGLKVLNLQENDLNGINILDRFPDVEEELQRVIRGETRNFEGKVRVDNTLHHFFNYYFLDEDSNCVVGITVDVTTQKEAEQQIFEKNIELSDALEKLTIAEEHLIKVNEELEKRVEERTYELRESEEELQQTLEQALELNELLKERETFLSRVIDQSPVSTYITDEKGTQIRVNEACLKLFDVPDPELGLGKYNILKDEILQKHPAYKDVEEVFTKGKIAKFEIDYDLANVSHIDIKNSKPLSLIGTVFPIINRYGKVTNAVVQHQDVTEQKVAVQKIKESAERFRLLLETIPQMAFTILPDGTNNYFNERWYQYTGQRFVSSGGPVWKNVIHSDDFSATASKWSTSITSGNVYEMENRLKRTDDNMYRWHLTRAVPIINDQGQIVLWVGTCTDIHDHRIVEEQILAKNIELTKINADLDNFIYTASHDLKAPVTNLEGLITLLNQQLQTHLNEKDNRLFEMMKVSISKFKSTIAGLVEITKAQKNLEKVDEKVDVSEVIHDVLINIDHLMEESDVTIIQDLSVKEIMYAKVNINSIVYNLLSNAIKYRSAERKPVVNIRTYEAEGNVVLEVEDNGLGIRKILQNKLFSMFKRLHSHVEGTGIGLYIIKRIVENNGGNIQVESEEGEGTKFIVNFGDITIKKNQV